MLARVGQVIERFRQGLGRELDDDAIRAACERAGYTWRERKLDPITTVRLFFLQIVWGNTACNHVPHLAKTDVTGSAYCEARARLPLEVLQTLLTRCTARLSESVRETGRWLGHRLFLCDGSSFSMPDTDQLREHFGQSGQQQRGCGFPTAHWLALLPFGSGLFQKVVAGPLRTHDMASVAQLHRELEADDVLLGDRAFCSFFHIALLVSRGIHGIFRAHQKLLIDFTPGRPHGHPRRGKSTSRKGLPRSRWLKSCGFEDQIVEWFKPARVPNWMSAEALAAAPETLVVRELRYRVARPGFRVREVTLITTLCDATCYTADDLAQAYGLRWTIEVYQPEYPSSVRLYQLAA